MIKLHTYEIIAQTITAVKKLSKTSIFPLHGALFADWGAGKTIASKQIVKNFEGVYYYKATVRPLNPVQFFKDMLEQIGVFVVRSYVESYRNFIEFLRDEEVSEPVLIIDEAQNIFTKPTILSLLKDLSEDLDIRLSYVFIGDEKLNQLINSPIEPHAIVKRIKIRQKIPNITEKTIKKLAEHYQLQINDETTKKIKEITTYFKATTIDVDMTFHSLKIANTKQIDPQTFKEILKEILFIDQRKRGIKNV